MKINKYVIQVLFTLSCERQWKQTLLITKWSRHFFSSHCSADFFFLSPPHTELWAYTSTQIFCEVTTHLNVHQVCASHSGDMLQWISSPLAWRRVVKMTWAQTFNCCVSFVATAPHLLYTAVKQAWRMSDTVTNTRKKAQLWGAQNLATTLTKSHKDRSEVLETQQIGSQPSHKDWF